MRPIAAWSVAQREGSAINAGRPSHAGAPAVADNYDDLEWKAVVGCG
jgi:hypothetical protein